MKQKKKKKRQDAKKNDDDDDDDDVIFRFGEAKNVSLKSLSNKKKKGRREKKKGRKDVICTCREGVFSHVSRLFVSLLIVSLL